MSDADSTSTTLPVKPERPEGSPLFWIRDGRPTQRVRGKLVFHGRWAKKIRGRLVYFGRASHDEALAEYQRKRADLHAGRKPREDLAGALTVGVLCGRFIDAKIVQRDNGELSERLFAEYGETCKRLIRVFGKSRLVSDLGPDDFGTLRKLMAKNWGLVRLKAEIIRSKTPFNWAVKAGLIDRPPVCGEAFNVPTAGALRRERATKPAKLFTAGELDRIIAAAGQPLRPMILLGINCGFGNGDIAALPIRALDLDGGWLTFPRPKTGINRRIPLWPETVAAIREWLRVRPEPADAADAGLVFVTYKRGNWKDDTGRALPHEMRKLLDRLKIADRSFYCLRHTFQTIGDESRDSIATRKIMGHVIRDISEGYRHHVSDQRLRHVTDYLRTWLFGGRDADGDNPDVLRFKVG
jgi:integrase